MPDESTTPAPTRRIPRRTLAKGAAWAVPVVATVAAAPAYAAKSGETLPPCVKKITNDSVNWNVDGVQYSTCNTYCSHRDVRLTFHIDACDNPVTIRVSNVTGNSTWCAWNTGTGTLTKTVPAGTTGGTLTFPNTGDVISGGGGCTITAYESANDGMHINPCTNGPYFKYEVFYSATATGTPAYTGTWGDANNPPKPNNVLPTAAPTGLAVTRSATTGSPTITATWSALAGADSYDLEWAQSTSSTVSTCTFSSSSTSVNSIHATTWTSLSASNNLRCVHVRVRARNCKGTGPWSGWVELKGGQLNRLIQASDEAATPNEAPATSSGGTVEKQNPAAEQESSTHPPAAPAPVTDAPVADAPVADVPATPAPAADAPAEG